MAFSAVLATGTPLIPFLHSGEDVIFFIYVLTRVAGLFIAAPLLSNQLMSRSVRSLIMIFLGAIMTMTLYPDYRGIHPKYILPELVPGANISMIMLSMTLVKEFAVGWLLGFIFSIVYEAVLLAGQQVGMMIGFSMSEILDPVSNTSQSMIGYFFTIFTSLLILVTDIHHVFIIALVDSFQTIPIGNYHMPYEILHKITHGSNLSFDYGLRIAAVPFAALALITIGLGFMARVMPEMNIFMVGFPLRILMGYYTMLVTIIYFPSLINQAFVEYGNLAVRVISLVGNV
jgi:flagellar biosynthetic protein FliR